MGIITIFWTDERENHRQAKQFTDRDEADKFIEELKQDKHCFSIKEWNEKGEQS